MPMAQAGSKMRSRHVAVAAVAALTAVAMASAVAADSASLAAVQQVQDAVSQLSTSFAAFAKAALAKADAEGAALDRLLSAVTGGGNGANGSGSGRNTGAVVPPPPPPPSAAASVAPAAAARPRFAIIGLAQGFELWFSYSFIRSARQAGMPASLVDIVLFTDDVGGERGWVFEQFGVKVQRFDPSTLPEHYRSYHPSSYRWILIRDWMVAEAAAAAGRGEQPYEAVLFADVRDTIFQRSPFEHVHAAAPGFYAFSEAKPRTIVSERVARRCAWRAVGATSPLSLRPGCAQSECGWNSGWVRDCFGDAGLAAVGHNVISCSGTSMGTWPEALAYVNLLADELVTRRSCERNGVDQGMHNYFVFGGGLTAALGGAADRLHVISNEEGWIATVQSMPTIQRDYAGRVLNAAGQIVALVHQYDRSAALKEQYRAQFTWLATEEERRRK